ncbi:MAG: outer membrane protein assembly factor BamE [Ignavibacteriae bacterium]|nr:outer membrane protein assembly factor BamE [Ignavibacteriota bacterium]
MKKTTKIVIGLFVIPFLVLVLIINYYGHFSPKAIKAKENLEHSYNVKIGMTKDEVIKIMGKPDQITNVNIYNYHYDLNDDSKGSGQISFDSTKRVTRIDFPGGNIQGEFIFH